MLLTQPTGPGNESELDKGVAGLLMTNHYHASGDAPRMCNIECRGVTFLL